MKDIRQRLLATFQVEHTEHVQRIRESLAALEASEAAPVAADVDDIFRRAHSLKGAARAVDLRPLEQLAHRLETLFSRVREGAARLDRPTIKAIYQVLDASEDWLASMGGAQDSSRHSDALASIDALLERLSDALPTDLSNPLLAGVSVPAAKTSSEPEVKAIETPSPITSAPLPQVDTLRLSAESLDRIVSSAGQLLTESLRQARVTHSLRQMSQRAAETVAEGERLRKSGVRALRKLESSPELASAARYVNYLDHQLRLLSKQAEAAARLQEQNAWTLRSLTNDLQLGVRRARMVPVENVFDGFRKMVRDLARDAGKVIDLHVSGWHVEADRVVLQELKDPVMHILRNAISHGLESEAERSSKGKQPAGRIDLAVEVQGNRLSVTIEDDGKGIDVARVSEIATRQGLIRESERASLSESDLLRMVLLPGFSTSRSVTDLSGRGMGLSVVAQAVARLQGAVEIGHGKNGGTRVAISTPLSVSSHRLLLVTCQGRTLAIPVHAIEGLRRLKLSEMHTVQSRPAIHIDGQSIPVVSLAHLLNAAEPTVSIANNTLYVAVMRSGSRRIAVAVDAFLSETDAIVKELPAPADRNPKIAGGVLREDGSICLVLNATETLVGFQTSSDPLVLAAEEDARADQSADKSREILVVDDSLTTRTLEKSVLEAHGYQVAIAVDGIDALNYLRTAPVGLVISDLQMPRLDGFGLLGEIRKDPRLAHIPVIIVSSLENPADQARGMTLGADAYVVKRKFDQQDLLDTIRQIL